MSLSDELLADFEDEGMNVDGSEAPKLEPIEEMEEEDTTAFPDASVRFVGL